MPPAPSFTSAVSSRSSSSSHSIKKAFKGFYSVGWVKSAHGIRGELFVRLAAGQADWLEQVQELALLTPPYENLKIFEIQKVRPHKDGLIVAFKEVPSRNEAEMLVKSQVYIREECLTAEEGESIYLHQIQGFTLVDPQGAILGQITGFGTNGPQDLLRVQTPQGEALVPFVDAFLLAIDFDKRQVSMDLPQGLLSLEEK